MSAHYRSVHIVQCEFVEKIVHRLLAGHRGPPLRAPREKSGLAVDVEINAVRMLEDDRADTGLGIHHVAFG